MLELFIPGQPIQQGSMIPGRPVRGKNGQMRSTMHSHNPEDLKRWRGAIAAAIRKAGHDPIGPYVAVSAVFHMAKPATTKYPDYPAGTPDLDKLQRALGDALTASGLVEDDARIVRWHTDEVWAGGLGSSMSTPGVALRVEHR